MATHATHIDLYIDPMDDDLPYCLKKPDERSSYKVTYEIDQQSGNDGFPEAKLMIFDTPQMAIMAKFIIEQVDGDAVVKVAQAPTGEGILIMATDNYSFGGKISEAILVIDKREVFKGFPLDPSWEQHDFHLDFRSTKCTDTNASLIENIAHQASELSEGELETLQEKLSAINTPKQKI